MTVSRKFAPPRRASGLLTRHALCERFEALTWPPTRVLLVVAGTGYGKTELVRAACDRMHDPLAWLSLDPEDQDLKLFLTGIIKAIKVAVPDFTTSATELLDQQSDPVSTAMQATLALLEDLEGKLEGGLTLVLDDYQAVDTPAINRVMSRLIKYLPACVRLVVTSRTMPSLELGLGKGELETWGEAELQLTPQEADELLSDLSAEVRATVRERTEGWIAALLLYRDALLRSPERASLHWRVFLDGFFEQEVLPKQPPEIQDFLVRASMLETLEPKLCEQALELGDSAQAIAYLKKHHVFVLTSDEGDLRLHPLFRDFLQERLRRQASPQDLGRWSEALGARQWEAGRYLQALDTWLQSGLTERSVSAVESLASSWSTSQGLTLLESALAKLPENAIPPGLCLVYGDVLRHWGEVDRAMPLLERARHAFVLAQNPEGEGRAQTLLAACWGLKGQLGPMREAIERAVRLLGPDDPPTLALARIVRGNLCLLSGSDVSEAIGHFEASLELARVAGDRYGEARALHNLGVAYTKRGAFAHAMQRYDEGIALSAVNGGIPHVWMTPINRCLLLLYLGRAQEARAESQAVVERTRHLRLAREESCALRALAQADTHLGRFQEAGEGLRMAEAIADRLGDRAGLANVHHLRSYLAFRQGRLLEALEHENRALGVVGAVELDARHLEFAQFRARLLVALGRLDEAEGLLQRILGWLEDQPFELHRVEAWLTAGSLYAARDDAKRSADFQARAELLAREQGYDISVLRAEVTRPAPVEAPPRLQLSFFGGFQAVCEGRTIGTKDWQSAKAKWLLAYLVEQSAGATKAFLLEALFSDEATDASVTMTVTRTRKALEPSLPPKAPSTYVLFQGGRYLFNALSSFSADTREFARRLEEAQAGGADEPARLCAALDLYAGDFLPEFSDPWVESKRQYYRAKAIEATKRLFELWHAAGNFARAIEAAQRGLAIDACDEELHRFLIEHFIERNQPQRAREQFRLCTESLAKQLGIGPSADLKRLVSGIGVT